MFFSSVVERRGEDLAVVLDQPAALVRAAHEGEEDAAVDALQGLLHGLAGDDAFIVFAQNDVDGAPQNGDLGHRQKADSADQDEQAAETEDQFLPDSEHDGAPPTSR